MRDKNGRFIRGMPNDNRGERHGLWKGERASYGAIHFWVYRNFGRPTSCEICLENKKRLEWSNISGEYKRVRKDWRQLCVKCHRNIDGCGSPEVWKKAWATKQAKYGITGRRSKETV